MATIDYSKINKYGLYAKPNPADFTQLIPSKTYMTPPQTNQFGQTYESALSSYNQWSNDPEAVALRITNEQNKYAPVVKADGTPLFDNTFYEGLATGTVTNAQLQTQLDTWANDILKNDASVNWELTNGAVDTNPTYKAAKTKLLNDLANNPNFVKLNQSKIDAKKVAEEKAVADAKLIEDQKIATEKANTDAAAATATDLANQQALETANALKLKNATAPLDTKTLGGGFDALGNPINSTVTSGITQDMINKGMLNVTKVDAANTIRNQTIDKTGTNSSADVAKLVDAAKAYNVNVTPDSMVSNQLSGLLSKNNPYIQQAVNSANLQASRRGMLNTGAAAGFATDAAIKNALPIAQADALTIGKANEANASAQNTLLNTGLNLKSTSLDRAAQNMASINTENAKLAAQIDSWNATNKITVDSTNAKAINDATNLFTTAMLNDLNNLATSNRDNSAKLNQLITSGNIEIAGKVTQSVIDGLTADKKLESDKKLAVFTETLKQQTNQITAENQAMLDTLKYDRDAYNTVIQANATLDAELLNSIKAINLTPDMSETAKAANANGLTMMANAMKKNNIATAVSRSQLINSDAGKTATSLVSPPNK